MPTEQFTFTGRDDATLYAYAFMPPTPPSAVLQIAHGMGEHAARYGDFASFLNQAGIAVFANDHRGHGATAEQSGTPGYFTEKDGWEVVVSDMQALTRVATERLPGLPIFLLGHSMGSLLARSYAMRYGEPLAGLILSASTISSPPLTLVAKLASRMEKWRRGSTTPSQLLHNFTFTPFIKSITNRRTDFDWLSRDPVEVDKYINDPWCGNVMSAGFYSDLAYGLAEICAHDAAALPPPTLPVLIISGTNDPVSHFGSDTIALAHMFKSAGVKDVSYHVYDGGRHELLNETNRAEVYQDLLNWMNAKNPPQ